MNGKLVRAKSVLFSYLAGMSLRVMNRIE
jgi:hypothetical protein